MGIRKRSDRTKDTFTNKTKSAVRKTGSEKLMDDAISMTEDTVTLWHRFVVGFHKGMSFLLKFLPFIIALMMLLYGVARWYSCIHDQLPFSQYWYIYISSTIMVVCGILMAVFHKAPMTTLIGFFTIGIASNRLLQGINMFFSHMDNEILKYVYPIVGVVFIALASNMLVSTTYYLRGISRKRRGMLISGVLFLIIETVSIVLMIRLMGMTPQQIFEDDPSTVSRIALYIVYIILLSTDEIRSRELLEHQSRALDGIRTTYICDPQARIDRHVAVEVANIDGNWEKWKDKRGWGPVEYEYRFSIKNRSDFSFVTVQKWKDSERLYFTVAKNHHGSLLDANRFAVDEILLDGTPEECNNIRFYNNEGLYIQIPVKDKKENDIDDRYL